MAFQAAKMICGIVLLTSGAILGTGCGERANFGGASATNRVQDRSLEANEAGEADGSENRGQPTTNETDQNSGELKSPSDDGTGADGEEVSGDDAEGADDGAGDDGTPTATVPSPAAPVIPERCPSAVSDATYSALAQQPALPIRTAAELMAVRSGRHYQIQQDLVLTGEWTPIPLKERMLIDGNGKTISGLRVGSGDVGMIGSVPIGTTTALHDVISGGPLQDAGLFARISCSLIKNLKIHGATITARRNVGVLAGQADKGSRLEGIQITDAQLYANANVGGIVGQLLQSRLSGSRATVAVRLNPYDPARLPPRVTVKTSSGQHIGGLAGVVKGGEIKKNTATMDFVGRVVAAPDLPGQIFSVGGALGTVTISLVEETRAYGSIQDGADLGGLIGSVGSQYVSGTDNSNIRNNHADVAISTATEWVDSGRRPAVGGLIAFSQGATISKSYATGRITVSGTPPPTSYSHIGGLVGYTTPINQCCRSSNYSYWDLESSGVSTNMYGNDGKTTAQMKTAATFAAWDGNIWLIQDGAYPELRLP